MEMQLSRDIPISIYPPIMLYNKGDVKTIWNTPNKGVIDAILYVHIPFCPRKCDFCYFTSFSVGKEKMIKYMERLCEDIKEYGNNCRAQSKIISAIYIGGGTPTFLPEELLRQLFNAIYESFLLSDDCEICVETRPGPEMTSSKILLLKQLGVNRISMGVQSFDSDVLLANGRYCDAKQSIILYNNLLSTGFDFINIDIMSGMNGETEKTWQSTINQLLDLQPANITIYKMQRYENSKMAKNNAHTHSGISTEKELEQTKIFYGSMKQSGYFLSTSTYSFSKAPKYLNKYRQYRNDGAEIVALGLSSNGYINGHVYQSIYDLNSYLNRKTVISNAYFMNQNEITIRGLMLGLKSGMIDRALYKKHFGKDPLELYNKQISHMEQDQLISISPDAILLANDAIYYIDHIIRDYVMPEKIREIENILLQYKNFSIKQQGE